MIRSPLMQSPNLFAGIGFILSLPALYFVTANILKYELGLLGTMEIYAFSPIVLLGGTMLAVGLNLFPILHFAIQKGEDTITITTTIKTRLWNMTVLLAGVLLFVILFGYAVVENLMSH